MNKRIIDPTEALIRINFILHYMKLGMYESVDIVTMNRLNLVQLHK